MKRLITTALALSLLSGAAAHAGAAGAVVAQDQQQPGQPQREGGPRAFWVGGAPRVAKRTVSTAITWVCFETLMEVAGERAAVDGNEQ